MAAIDDRDLITNDEAAEIFGVAVKTWTSYVARGQVDVAVHRRFGRPLYLRDDVIAARAARRRHRVRHRDSGAPSAAEAEILAELRRSQRDLEDAQQRRRQSAKSLYAKGYSKAFIARELNVSRQTAGRLVDEA